MAKKKPTEETIQDVKDTDELSRFQAAAREINETIKLEPSINVEDNLNGLRTELKEIADILDPGDRFSPPTMAVLRELGWMPNDSGEEAPEDENDSEADAPVMMPGETEREAVARQAKTSASKKEKSGGKVTAKPVKTPAKPSSRGVPRGPRVSTGERATNAKGNSTLTSYVNSRLLDGVSIADLAAETVGKAEEYGVKPMSVGQVRAHIKFLNNHGKFSVTVSEDGFAKAERVAQMPVEIVE